jgi:hypothetical protein
MKKLLLTFACISGAFAGQAFAACEDDQIDPSSVLPGKTVCGLEPGGTTYQWQEYHDPNGNLIEYAKGPNHPVDPTHQVGTWYATADNVSYTYGSTTYTFTLHSANNTDYSFCDASGEKATATLEAGQGACP